MNAAIRPKLAFKVWLETQEGYVFGPGIYDLLKKVRETGTLKEAAESLGMSYRYAWGLVRKAEEKLGQGLLSAHKGGKDGGGGAELTKVGLRFVEEFSKIEDAVSRISRDSWWADDFPAVSMVEGLVTEVKIGGNRAEISLRLAEPTVLKLNVPKEIVTGEGITRGDSLSVDLNPSIISKADRS